MPAKAMTIEQFAADRGLLTTADVDSHIHAGLRSMPTTKSYARWNGRLLRDLQDARDETRRAYQAAIDAGEVRQLTSSEQLADTAFGHPDNAATQAAQRVLAKRQQRALAA